MQISIRKNIKQIKLNILATGRFRARLERDEVSGVLVLRESVEIIKELETRDTEQERQCQEPGHDANISR